MFNLNVPEDNACLMTKKSLAPLHYWALPTFVLKSRRCHRGSPSCVHKGPD